MAGETMTIKKGANGYELGGRTLVRGDVLELVGGQSITWRPRAMDPDVYEIPADGLDASFDDQAPSGATFYLHRPAPDGRIVGRGWADMAVDEAWEFTPFILDNLFASTALEADMARRMDEAAAKFAAMANTNIDMNKCPLVDDSGWSNEPPGRDSASATTPLTVVVVVDERTVRGLRAVGRNGDISDGAAAVLAQWIQDWENSSPEWWATAETTKQ
jgi:hypothetical protein